MDLGHLSVAVADRVGQRGGRPGPAEQHQIRLGRRAPVPVVAGEQDLVALRVDGLHPELSAGHRQGPGQPGREAAGHVLDDVRRQDVAEQLAPRRVGPGEGDDGLLAALDRLHAGDQVIAGRVDHAGLADHLPPQVPEVVRGDRGVVGPLRLRPDLVGDRERVFVGHLGGHQQRRVQLPPRARRRVRIGHRPEGAGQHQRADRGVHRATESDSRCGLNPAPIESMPMMICVLRCGGGGGAARGLGALRRRRWADGASDEHQQRNQQAGGRISAAGWFRHAPQGIGAAMRPSTLNATR